MMRLGRARATGLLAAAVFAVFAWGLVRLVVFQVRQPDAYPMYSTFRTDPLGAGALYESLARIPGRRVERNFGPFDRISDPARTTLFVIGAGAPPGGRGEEAEALLTFVRSGGRLVWAARMPSTQPLTPAAPVCASCCPTEPVYAPGSGWGGVLAWGDGERPESADLHSDAVGAGLPDRIPLHSRGVIRNMDSSWRVIYTGASGPVVAERAMGRGSVVLTTAYYLFSNEGLSRDAQPAFLAWCVGDAVRIVFDETQHGMAMRPGVAALVGRRLNGLLAGLAILAALFIWRNSSGLVPPDPEAEHRASTAPTGRAAQEGLIQLLRRNLPERELPDACWREFARDMPRGDPAAKHLDALRAELEAERARPPRQRDPVAWYNRLADHLQAGHRKKGHRDEQ